MIFRKIFGFLGIEGWSGVSDIYLMVIIGATIGMMALYYFLVYEKFDRPKRITIIGNIKKILIMTALLIFLIYWT